MKTNNSLVAYALLRVAMGVNMLGHGLARIPKLDAFSDNMVTNFQKSWLPSLSIKIFWLALPFAEFLIGLLLIIGLFTYRTSVAGAILIILLLFGSSTIENWEAMGIQMIYALFFYQLITQINNNSYAADHLFKNKIRQNESNRI